MLWESHDRKLISGLSKNGAWTYGSTGNEWTKWCETIVNLEFFACEGISGDTVGSQGYV